jgi:hypothetical protein
MPRGVKSASLASRSKRKGSALGRRLVAGFSEALAHARGEIELPSFTVTVPDRVDVAKLRHRLGLSQRAVKPNNKNITVYFSFESVIVTPVSFQMRGVSRSSDTRDEMRWTRQRRAWP